jgi:recombination protein RecR
MDTINRLIEQFRQFPGIGPRQAKRFVYFLLSQPESYRATLMKTVGELGKHIRVCRECHRFFPISAGSAIVSLCPICSDPNRNNETLMIVSRDVDFENIEKSHSYTGKYFILGGSIPILEKEPESRIRLRELKTLIENRATNKQALETNKQALKGAPTTSESLKEIIFALNLTPEGENTEEYLRSVLAPLLEKLPHGASSISLSSLGRGLSTGLELEYSDSDTIKNALKNRS